MAGIRKSYYENGMLKKVTVLYVLGMEQTGPQKRLPGDGLLKEKTIYRVGKQAVPAKYKV